jgi:hypothetical protein
VSEERTAANGEHADRRHELAGLGDQLAETLTDAEVEAAQALAREILATRR